MKLPETLPEWTLASVLLIPHFLLVAFLSAGSPERDIIGIHTLKDFTDVLYNLAAIMASFIALIAYSNWKKEKQAEWDKNVKEKISSELSEAGDLLYELGEITYELNTIAALVDSASTKIG